MGATKLGLLALLTCVGTTWAQSSGDWTPTRVWSTIHTTCLDERSQEEMLKNAKKGDVKAQDTLGSLYLSTCKGPFDASKGLELLAQAAGHGDAHAQVMLGNLYENGQHVTKNSQMAAAWYTKAAEQHYPQGENNLALVLAMDATMKDEAQAVKMFRAAAEHGLPEGAFNLATMYDRGWGVAQDYSMARKWYAKASEQKISAAEYRLAMLMEAGLGGAKDQAAADAMYKQAADHGSDEAEERLGRKSPYLATSPNSGYFQLVAAMQMLDQKNANYDPVKGLKFLEKAAEIGHPRAMTQLGWIYANGQAGLTKDEPRAIQYYQQAITRDPTFAIPYNNYAWILVSSDNPKMRDPKKALELALKAVALGEGKNGGHLDTLACAYFELGQVDKALEIETKAAELSPQNESIKQTLIKFQAAKKEAKK
jgi:TPR repeat protein